MFSDRMFQITKDGKYMDVVETALYNTLLSGIALDGKHFFYVNPLEVIPEIAEKNPTMRHVETTRQLWFGVACCPPNITRTLASLGNYIYAQDQNTMYLNLYINSEITGIINGTDVTLKVFADYPSKGDVKLEVYPQRDGETFTIAVRKPGYSKTCEVKVNGKVIPYEAIQWWPII